MTCSLCNEPIVDNDFIVGVDPDMAEVWQMLVAHTQCVMGVTETMKQVLDEDDTET
jgi:hypothetical protein